MDDEKLRQEFPGNAYTDIQPSSTEVPDLNQSLPVEKEKKPDNPKPVKNKPKAPKKLTIGERLIESAKTIDPVEMFEDLISEWLFPGMQAMGEKILRIIFNPNGLKNLESSNRNSRANRTYYNSIYDGPSRKNRRTSSLKPEIPFKTRSEAEQVLSALTEYIDEYGKVTVKEFYSLVDEITDGEISISVDYPAQGYGWRSIEGAEINFVRAGYLLTMPKAEVL